MPKRPRYPMPVDAAGSLDGTGLQAVYDCRPAYQRNDYTGWITGGVRPQIRQNRDARMLQEPKEGNVCMGMVWHGK